ncbi:hypothetical protein ACJ41O_015013 [Fusarium nematophilum]
MSDESTFSNFHAASAAPAIHKCSVCSRGFIRPDHLARHERAHSKSRPFHCGLCGRRFGRRDVLLRHFSHLHRGQHPLEYVDSDLVQHKPTPRSQSSSASIDTVAQPAGPGPSPSGSDVHPGPLSTAILAESDLDDFLDLLVAVPSYSDLTRPWAFGLPNGQRSLSRATTRPLENRDLLPITPGQQLGLLGMRSKRPQCDIAPMLPSFHDGLFPPDELTCPSPHGRPKPHSLPSLTQSTFDRLVESYKCHCATIRPFLHMPTLDVSLYTLSSGAAPGTLTHGQSCTQWKRQPHRALVFSILALGALCDQKEALALELYHRTRKEILDLLARLQKLGREEAPPLDLIQAFINYVSCGTTFGDKSIEDLTVGHTVSLRSLVEVSGLEKPASKPLCAQSTCESCSSNAPADWLEWVHYEERKRTFLTYFALMSSTLAYLDAIASMDWREVKHRMPSSDQTWVAESPSTWRSAFENQKPHTFFSAEVQALYSGVPSGGNSENDNIDPPTAKPATNDGMQTPRDDYSCFILIAAVYRDTWLQRLQDTVDINATRTALQRWQTHWLHLTSQEEIRSATPLLGCSLAMFDNTQLLLHLDVKEAKQALVSRDYGRFCVTLPALDLRLDSEGLGCSLLSGREDWQQICDIFLHTDRRMALRQLALYSMNALELTFKVHSRSRWDKSKFTFTPHAGIAMFYCIQILASWICFFANCLSCGLYANWLQASQDSEEWADICLLRKILAFAQNRTKQFNADFNIPKSPEMLDERSAGCLASDFLDLHSQIIRNCGAWPCMPTLPLPGEIC